MLHSRLIRNKVLPYFYAEMRQSFSLCMVIEGEIGGMSTRIGLIVSDEYVRVTVQ